MPVFSPFQEHKRKSGLVVRRASFTGQISPFLKNALTRGIRDSDRIPTNAVKRGKVMKSADSGQTNSVDSIGNGEPLYGPAAYTCFSPAANDSPLNSVDSIA